MRLLYATPDQLGTQTGGGQVTYHEFHALTYLGATTPFTDNSFSDPFTADDLLVNQLNNLSYDLAHFYAGTFTRSIKKLKELGCKVTYTAAAHDIDLSRDEHTKLGLAYNYPHLTDPSLWKRYLGGYLEADVLIVPSNHSADVMRKFGRTGTIEVIPHGTHLPESAKPPPEKFTIGYLGAVGPDKGIRYLLEAWAKLGYTDGSRLVLAGMYSTTFFIQELVARIFEERVDLVAVTDVNGEKLNRLLVTTKSGVEILLAGWVDKIADFYDNISLYIQPSITEGFGIEVLEAMAHGRPVLCSTGAGAADVVPPSWRFQAGDVESLVNKIAITKDIMSLAKTEIPAWCDGWRDWAELHTWDKIQEKYVKVWKELLG